MTQTLRPPWCSNQTRCRCLHTIKDVCIGYLTDLGSPVPYRNHYSLCFGPYSSVTLRTIDLVRVFKCLKAGAEFEQSLEPQPDLTQDY